MLQRRKISKNFNKEEGVLETNDIDLRRNVRGGVSFGSERGATWERGRLARDQEVQRHPQRLTYGIMGRRGGSTKIGGLKILQKKNRETRSGGIRLSSSKGYRGDLMGDLSGRGGQLQKKGNRYIL